MKEINGVKYIKISEFAQNEGVPLRTVYNYIEQGKIASEAVLDGRPKLIREDAMTWKPEAKAKKTEKQDTPSMKQQAPVKQQESMAFQEKILEEMRCSREETSLEFASYREQLKRKDEQLAESERQREADREYYADQLAEKDRLIDELTRQLRDTGGHMQRMNEQFGKLTDQAQQLQLVSMQQKQIQNTAETARPTENTGKEYSRKDVEILLEKTAKEAEKQNNILQKTVEFLKAQIENERQNAGEWREKYGELKCDPRLNIPADIHGRPVFTQCEEVKELLQKSEKKAKDDAFEEIEKEIRDMVSEIKAGKVYVLDGEMYSYRTILLSPVYLRLADLQSCAFKAGCDYGYEKRCNESRLPWRRSKK